MRDGVAVIALVRPDLLGTYGDTGNAIVLQQRLHRRGMPAAVVAVSSADGVPPDADVVVLGGAEDHAQGALAHDAALASGLRMVIDRGIPVLAVCAGLQVLGHRFPGPDGQPVLGLGLVDCETVGLRRRAVGEITARPLVEGVRLLTGFENHRGATVLGPQAAPLARVVSGIGNGVDGHEGLVQGSVIGTYLHGPVLGRNPDLADLLLGRAFGALPPLDMASVSELRRERILASRAAQMTLFGRWRRDRVSAVRQARRPRGG